MTTCNTVASFFLPCDPIPAPRPRAVSRGRGFASIYHPTSYTSWKENVAGLVKDSPGIPEDVLTGPLRVEIDVLVTKPRTSKLQHPSPDVDNYAKGVLDAITQSERVWKDDKQIVTLRITKTWVTGDTAPGFAVRISSI